MSLYYYCNAKCKAIRTKKGKAFRQEEGTGYVSPQNHLKSCAGDQLEQIFIDHLHDASDRLESFCSNFLRNRNVFKLIKSVVMLSISLLEAVDPVACSMLNIFLILAKTLRKYILSLIPIIG